MPGIPGGLSFPHCNLEWPAFAAYSSLSSNVRQLQSPCAAWVWTHLAGWWPSSPCWWPRCVDPPATLITFELLQPIIRADATSQADDEHALRQSALARVSGAVGETAKQLICGYCPLQPSGKQARQMRKGKRTLGLSHSFIPPVQGW